MNHAPDVERAPSRARMRGLSAGFSAAWAVLLVLVVARGLGRVNEELRDLRRKLDGAGTPPK